MSFEKPPQFSPELSRSSAENAEKKEALIADSLDALHSFLADHHQDNDHTPLEDIFREDVEASVREAWTKPRGDFQWTPMLQAYKRILFYQPKVRTIDDTTRVELATVVGLNDSRDEALTEELNTRLHNHTNGAWYEQVGLTPPAE